MAQEENDACITDVLLDTILHSLLVLEGRRTTLDVMDRGQQCCFSGIWLGKGSEGLVN